VSTIIYVEGDKMLCDTPCFLNSLAYKSVILNKDLEIVFINDDWKEYISKSDNEIKDNSIGLNYIELIESLNNSAADYSAEINLGIKAVIKNKKDKFELEYQDSSSGNRSWVKMIVTPFAEGVLIMHEDITDRKNYEEALQIREEQYKKIFNTAPIGMLVEDPEGNILEVNEELCEMTGYSKDELIGDSIFNKLVTPDRIEEAKKDIEIILSGQDLEFNLDNINKNGEHYYTHFKETKINLPDKGTGILSMQVDLTNLRMKEKKLEFLSYNDQLTGLYNRAYFDQELKRLDNQDELPLSLVVIDVNGLKMINDVYGHLAGDELIKSAAAVLKSCLRDEDILARFGGDEFALILPQTPKKDVEKIIKRIKEESNKVDVEGNKLSLGIGFATKTEMEEEIEQIFDQADENMYKDKLVKSKDSKNNIIKNLIITLEAKSNENKEHVQRLEELAVKLGRRLDLSYEQLSNLSLLASIHDIGKVTISEGILKKPDKLNEDEWETMKKHAERGYKIASSTEEFSAIAKYILHHHEKWDGTGYPNGLKGEEIPLFSRIIAIVDAYDVMTHARPYSDPLSKEEALKEIKKCSGSQFDPELVEEFVDLILEDKE
jgi:diguanylate cyclase (GGDEF)-like protein/PAS domain S-box-containing protein